MRKFSAFLMIAGVAAVAAGLGIQAVYASNADFQSLSSALESYTSLGKLTPSLVGEMLNKGINLGYGFRMSVKEALQYAGTSSKEAAQVLSRLRLYAATPTIAWSGAGALGLGVVLSLLGRKRSEAVSYR